MKRFWNNVRSLFSNEVRFKLRIEKLSKNTKNKEKRIIELADMIIEELEAEAGGGVGNIVLWYNYRHSKYKNISVCPNSQDKSIIKAVNHTFEGVPNPNYMGE